PFPRHPTPPPSAASSWSPLFAVFFKHKTAYELGLGIPAEPLFRSSHTADSEVDLVHQQTQNQRYGSSHLGATAKDISNVVTDARSEERRVGKERRSRRERGAGDKTDP